MAGIYIHIPFCIKLCSYCDFYHIISPSDHAPFVNALLKELTMRREYTGNEKISTIYFGGGTPSVLKTEDIVNILSSIRKQYNVADDCEITIEVNPDDISPAYAGRLKDTGVNRVSIGIQSWRDADLRLLNRRHDSAAAAFALNTILNAGFGNVTVDLIYGIPGLTTAGWAYNLDTTFSYGIRHLSAYHLTIEPRTLFGRMKDKGILTEIDEEESNSQFNLLIEKAAAAGFIHYEISNFARPGFLSIHNSNYWKQVTYLGVGPAAHSFDGHSRQWNIADLKKYIKGIKSGTLSFEREELDTKTRFNEYIMTSLRTMWGIDLDYVEKVFDKEGYDYLVNLAGKFVGYGLMNQDKKTLVLTNQGKMISDNIISELMLP